MQWIDIGANLTHESFAHDREAVIERARSQGVVQIIVTGASIDSSTAALELTLRYPGTLFATAGVHPHHAAQLQQSDLARLRELLAQSNVVAAGECGLDYYRNFSEPLAQRQAFEWQLRLAADSRKPVFLHQRDAHEDFVALLREHRASLVGGVAHCFTAGERELEDYLQLDLSIGITGWINDERRGTHLKALMPRIPPGRLLLETDAPYLLPRDLNVKPASRRNEPMFLGHIGAAIARARGQSVAQCALETSAHARTLFNLPTPVMIS
jgi:TatD DNase family protein